MTSCSGSKNSFWAESDPCSIYNMKPFFFFSFMMKSRMTRNQKAKKGPGSGFWSAFRVDMWFFLLFPRFKIHEYFASFASISTEFQESLSVVLMNLDFVLLLNPNGLKRRRKNIYFVLLFSVRKFLKFPNYSVTRHIYIHSYITRYIHCIQLTFVIE